MGVPLHAAVLLLTAAAFTTGLWLSSERARWKLGLLAAVAVTLALVLVPPTTRALLGSEGLVEAVTEGALLAILVRAIPLRSPWMIAAAALLLLEELDYGQVLFGFETPQFLIPPGSRSEKLNFHNAWFAGLWRTVPIASMLLLALPERLRPHWADRVRLPRFHLSAWIGVALAIPLALAVNARLGNRAADESFELAMVCLVCATWIIPARRPPDQHS